VWRSREYLQYFGGEKFRKETTWVNLGIDGKAYIGFIWLWVWHIGGL
jgi:hypothetical protein